MPNDETDDDRPGCDGDNHYTVLASGVPFLLEYVLGGGPCNVSIEDVAASLSKLCRYTGHCEPFYSVAQHCVHCRNVAQAMQESPLAQLACLLHDSAEIIMNDVAAPVKAMLPEYKRIERIFLRAILANLLPNEDLDEIMSLVASAAKPIDWAMYYLEARQRMPNPDAMLKGGENDMLKLNFVLPVWPPATAQSRFLRAFKEAQWLRQQQQAGLDWTGCLCPKADGL